MVPEEPLPKREIRVQRVHALVDTNNHLQQTRAANQCRQARSSERTGQTYETPLENGQKTGGVFALTRVVRSFVQGLGEVRALKKENGYGIAMKRKSASRLGLEQP